MAWLLNPDQTHFSTMKVQRGLKCSSFKKQVIIAALAATVYFIWRARNDSLWNERVPRMDKIVNSIKVENENRSTNRKES